MKKLFIVSGLIALSINAFAENSLETTDALRSILSLRTYHGVVPNTAEACVVSIFESADGITVSGATTTIVTDVTLTDADSYRWQPGQRYFVSGNKNEGRFGEKIEKSFMTRMITLDSQYMAVETISYKDRTPARRLVECEVSL